LGKATADVLKSEERLCLLNVADDVMPILEGITSMMYSSDQVAYMVNMVDLEISTHQQGSLGVRTNRIMMVCAVL